MISVLWMIPAMIFGALLGIFAIALVNAGRDDHPDQ